MSKGRVTLPAEAGQESTVKQLIAKWGADAIRDSDGTTLSPELLELGLPVYSTICIVRADQEYPRKHPTHLPQQFLQSRRVSGDGGELVVDLLDDYYRPKYAINVDDDPHKWWDVVDHTTDTIVPPEQWDYRDGCVYIHHAQPWHEYTVNFLVYQTWESVSMYNHLTNGWTSEKVIGLNPFVPEVYTHLMGYFDRWLEEHPKTSVVRFTTFAFMFMLVNDRNAKPRAVDWTGYCEAVSPLALEAFEKEKGYRLRSTDFVDNGCYNATCNPPSPRYLDWIDFINEFTVRFARDLVQKAHAAGKQAAMFWGDHWIGVEPYGERFAETGIDIHVGAAEDGCAVRRITDAPGNQVSEVRLYPYFFKDVFREGNNPVEESISNWRKMRRAMLVSPTIDRIGWGGYLSLASQFPDFVEHIAHIAEEFRTLCERIGQQKVWQAPVKVGVLNSWGKMRSWINQAGIQEKFKVARADVMTFVGSNLMECLAGLPVEIVFLSFRDIKENPAILDDMGVIINEGTAGSAWSGGEAWLDPECVTILRSWIAKGGGFIGIGDPSACEHQGRFFQFEDILGVQKETGRTMQNGANQGLACNEHFISADMESAFVPLNPESFIFPTTDEIQLIDIRNQHVHIAAHTFHQGRGVYLSSIPWCLENARLLYRAILWAGQAEDCTTRCYTSNPRTAFHYYPDKKCYALVNHTGENQKTITFDINGQSKEVALEADELRFIDEGL